MTRLPVLLIILLLICNSCMQQTSTRVEGDYDLTRPETFPMPSSLNEISGITFNRGMPDTMYAEQDEEGRLFSFPLATLEVKHRKFGKKGDYEDIAILNGTVVMLRSDGTLFSFPLDLTVGDDITGVQETSGLLPGGEYEAMYADEATGELYVLCKSCRDDDPRKSISGYILQLTTGKPPSLKSNFQVDTRSIAAKANGKKVVFRPSALAKRPAGKEWYVLSSVNKLLVTMDEHWKTREVYPLSPAIFGQPEGIAFDSNSNLYISNERGSAGNANVLKFTYIKEKK